MLSSPNKSKCPQRLIKLNSKLPTCGCKSYISPISQGLGLEIGHPLVEPFSDLLPRTPELRPRSGVARHRRVCLRVSRASHHHHQLTPTPPTNLPPTNNGTPQPPPTSTSTHSLWSPIFRRAECRIGPERPAAPTHTNGLLSRTTTLPTATTTTNNAPQPTRHRPRLKPQYLPPPSPRAPLRRRSPPQPR